LKKNAGKFIFKIFKEWKSNIKNFFWFNLIFNIIEIWLFSIATIR
jgi:hypothetical protein